MLLFIPHSFDPRVFLKKSEFVEGTFAESILYLLTQIEWRGYT